MVTRARKRTRARRGDGVLLREEILDATEALLLKTNDLDAVSIRAVATAVGITPPSIYMHFDRKEELILEVCERQFNVLDGAMLAAMEGVEDPVETVKAMGRAYVRFGLARPEHYHFLFMTKTPEWAGEHMRERIDSLAGFGRVIEAVERCIKAGEFRKEDPFLVACGLWMGVHGITSLLIGKPSFPWPKRDALIEHCLETYCDALRPRIAS